VAWLRFCIDAEHQTKQTKQLKVFKKIIDTNTKGIYLSKLRLFSSFLPTDSVWKGGCRVKIVTAKELSEFLKLTESTIYKLAATGELPGFKIGDSWRFDMDEILEQIRELKTPARKDRFSIEKAD